jgi:glutamate synthase (ferredoxin)
VKKRVASKYPYHDWMSAARSLSSKNFLAGPTKPADEVLRLQNTFGYSVEDTQMVIESMASQGKEPTFCMGDDIPLAALSSRPHMLYDYFKQRFAQVSLGPAEGWQGSGDIALGIGNAFQVYRRYESCSLQV